MFLSQMWKQKFNLSQLNRETIKKGRTLSMCIDLGENKTVLKPSWDQKQRRMNRKTPTLQVFQVYGLQGRAVDVGGANEWQAGSTVLFANVLNQWSKCCSSFIPRAAGKMRFLKGITLQPQEICSSWLCQLDIILVSYDCRYPKASTC